MGEPGATAILLLAGLLAGTVGTAGGITSIVSYPVLLFVGLSRLPADTVNLVAAVACWPGAALASRAELVNQRPRLLRAMAAAAAGAALGAVLLISTPASAFGRIVPYLVIAASVSLVLQPWLTRHMRGRRHAAAAITLPAVGLVSVYGGYFGAGSGVMLLAAWLVLVDDRMPHANAAKNMLVGATSVTASVVVVAGGSVAWSAVAPLAVGMFAGGTIGPRVSRHLPPAVIRWLVAALGAGLALQLWR
ncbi:sulfite exporter TauE/SafE family protein [uncultured Jatrophihabitans sp.]|uniref:sulfite exporter TauE/SafE family protein n=1 Tax=uncultured Jatrophihabitans sp. TaxID=1610747 RepID=UPI0035CC39AB